MNAPCKYCVGRKNGCHSICDKYKRYREYKDREYEIKDAQREINSYIDDEMYYNSKRRKRAYGKI